MNAIWPFDDPPNVVTITTRQVLDGDPILLVAHDADDGMWQVLRGTTDDASGGRVVSLQHMYEQDRSPGDLADLPLGWKAWRTSADAAWQRFEAEEPVDSSAEPGGPGS